MLGFHELGYRKPFTQLKLGSLLIGVFLVSQSAVAQPYYIAVDYHNNMVGQNLLVNAGKSFQDNKHSLEVGVKYLIWRPVDYDGNQYYYQQFFAEGFSQHWGSNLMYTRNFKISRNSNSRHLGVFVQNQLTHATTKSLYRSLPDANGKYEMVLASSVKPHTVMEQNIGLILNHEIIPKRLMIRYGGGMGISLIRNRNPYDIDAIVNGGAYWDYEFGRSFFLQIRYTFKPKSLEK